MGIVQEETAYFFFQKRALVQFCHEPVQIVVNIDTGHGVSAVDHGPGKGEQHFNAEGVGGVGDLLAVKFDLVDGRIDELPVDTVALPEPPEGVENDLLIRLGEDDNIPFTTEELNAMVGDGSEFVGRAPEQTEEYLSEVVDVRLDQYKDLIGAMDTALSV